MIESGSEYCNLVDKKWNVDENAAAICKKVPDMLTISENNLEKWLNSQP